MLYGCHIAEEKVDVEAVVYDVVQTLLKKQLEIIATTLSLPAEVKVGLHEPCCARGLQVGCCEIKQVTRV